MMMSDNINTDDTDKRMREVIATLSELKRRLVYEGDLSKESENLYNNIEQTLHQAIGELYGWTNEKTEKATDDKTT
jgi:argininosuccinate lyase